MSESTKKSKPEPKQISTDLTDAISQIRTILEHAEAEAQKIQIGVKAAGPRFRKDLRSIKGTVTQAIKRSIELRDAK